MDKVFHQLIEALKDCDQLLILPHNDPDPDAIASAVGLRYLVKVLFGVDSKIRYRGIIGRPENKALVRYLDEPLLKLKLSEIHQDSQIALVDTQPGAGNNPLPKDLQARIVIDHHPWTQSAWDAVFSDVRPAVGASATIVSEYLQAAQVDIPPKIATVLFYGIKTDTMGLGGKSSPEDVAAYIALQPIVDVEALSKIENPQVPSSYFKSLTSALQATLIYDRDVAISTLGLMSYPDLGAEIADLLLRLRGVKWVVCMGAYQGDLILSIRSRNKNIGAGKLAQMIVGDLGSAGGHGTRAGGQIRLKDLSPGKLADILAQKTLTTLKGDPSIAGKPLV